jgi:hypothetical protein
MRILCFVLFLIPLFSLAQKKDLYNGGVLAFSFQYGYQIPGGDLSKRFGNTNNPGIGVEYQTGSNWLIGAEFNYNFGVNVKEDVLNNLRYQTGAIYSRDNDIASIDLRQRGFVTQMTLGYIFPTVNPRSGIKVRLGAGYMQHWIRVQDNNDSVNQVFGEYGKGYDRMSGGLVISQFAGYQYIANNKLVNFFVGLEALQGFTKGRRDYQFDTMKPYLDSRIDLQWGIKAGWILPFFTQVAPETYLY